MGIWDSFISAGGNILSGVGSAFGVSAANDANRDIASDTNLLNYKMSWENQDFQREMSNTAYQRAMADMEKAGLNPMLAYSQGGASTPPGSAIAAQQPAPMQPVNFLEGLGKGVSSAIDYKRYERELKATDSQVRLNNALEEQAEAQKKLNENSAKVAEVNAKKGAAELGAVEATSRYMKRKAEKDDFFLDYDAVNERAKNTFGTLNSAFDLAKPFRGGTREVGVDTRTGEVLYETSKDPFWRRKR